MNATIQIVLLLGAVQGLLLSTFLFSIRTNKVSNRLLAFLTMIWGIVLMVFALQDRGLYVRFPHLYLVFDQLVLLFFPLLFLYVKYLFTSHYKFNLADLFHLLPFIISIVAYMGFFLKTGEQKTYIIKNPSGYIQALHTIVSEVIALQGIVYSILGLRMIRIYQKKIKEFESTVEKSIIKVLYAGIILTLFSWSIGIVGLHLDYMDIDIGFDYFAYTYLTLVLVIYIISYTAVKSPEIFKLDIHTVPDRSRNTKTLASISNALRNEGTVNQEEQNDNDHVLDDPALIKLNENLIRYMEDEKPYLNPELSLPELADSLNIPRNQLSGVINRFHKINFYEFVNQYRVDEVKRLMNDADNKRFKLISLAYDAGFNSKASFYRIFKQLTKMTPTEYLASL